MLAKLINNNLGHSYIFFNEAGYASVIVDKILLGKIQNETELNAKILNIDCDFLKNQKLKDFVTPGYMIYSEELSLNKDILEVEDLNSPSFEFIHNCEGK